MKASQLTGYGTSAALVWTDVPDPLGDGVLVRIRARAVNPIDIWTRQGALAAVTPSRTLPTLLGWDFAGDVVASGNGFSAGERVFGMIPWLTDTRHRGSYAELAVLDPGWLAPLPHAVGYADAAVLGLNALTAAQAVGRLLIRDGDKILVSGASGTVGAYAVQLATLGGAVVTALGSVGDEEHLKSLGSAYQLAIRSGEAASLATSLSTAFDGVVDAAGIAHELASVVKFGGTLVSTGNVDEHGGHAGIDQIALRAVVDPARSARLAELAASGSLTARISNRFPLSQAGAAHDAAEARSPRGKVVLIDD